MNKFESEINKKIQITINYEFKSDDLLLMVFKHPSFILDNTNNNFERLEFLGDRVLGLTIAHFLFKTFYDESEGDLAQRISELVSKKTLLEISNKLDFKQYMILLNGDKSSKVINDTILSDTLEALIGAIFIDGGFLKAKHFILSNWEQIVLNYKTPPRDPKSLLQEWAMANSLGMPIYNNYVKKGPDHSPMFSVRVKVKNLGSASGKGVSKKIAEMDAALNLYKKN